jgi:hypothetical protein
MRWFGLVTRDAVGQMASGIEIKDVVNQAPQFGRVYSAKLDSRASVEITIRSSYRGRYKSGELIQPNGRWIMFDPDRIAEKILDPVLVPIIQNVVNQVLELDHSFIHNDPSEYKDEHGVTWRRVS